LFTGNPETEAYFNPAHQHSGGQQRALAGAICAYAANIDNLAALGPAVELIAHKHCSLGIRPEHYPIVGKHLLLAIRDVLGEAASDEVLAAWGEAYGFLAEVFIEREKQLYGEQLAAPGGWNGYRPFIVKRKQPESETVSSFYLHPADDGALPAFKPGQYITLKVKHPEVAATPRNYSLSDRPDVGYFRISVKREPSPAAPAPSGLVSNHLHDNIREGDVLELGPPCGEFTLDPAKQVERPIVLISGGIGITPVMAMLQHLAHRQVTTPVYFIHCARNSRHHAFAEEVRRLAAECRNARIHFRYDEPLADDLSAGRCDSTGLIEMAFLKSLLPSNDAEFYFCGPRPFMAKVLASLKSWQVPDSRIHYEFFGPKQDLTPAKPHDHRPKMNAARDSVVVG
jgi:nitric oxide dioxygenase